MEDGGMTSYDDKRTAFFSELFLAYSGRLRRKAYSVLKDHHRAEDAVQMTFAAIFRNSDKLDLDINSKKTQSYLYTTLLNTTYNIIRENKKYQYANENQSDDDGFLGTDTDEHIYEKVSYEELLNEIRALPPSYSQVMILYYVHQCTFKEIGDLLEISEPLARQRLHRAKMKLQQRLSRY